MSEKKKEKTQYMRVEYLNLEDEKDAWNGLQKETEWMEEQEDFRFLQSKHSIEDMREACSAQDHVMIQLLERQNELLHVLKRNRGRLLLSLWGSHLSARDRRTGKCIFVHTGTDRKGVVPGI